MELSELRSKIDGVDRELIRLLEQRMDISLKIAAWKKTNGVPVLDAARERQKLAAVRAQCRPETAEAIAEIFRSIMMSSRAVQTARMVECHGE